ncbi:hypothetical protein [Ideonella sp. A 288]|uniref:hypothetical protein n=1 Tax=Ideonella sp. A 288 TaxID=1962181 RepID=UPI000B4BB511|nr:hypothetical protein [Ideonella sp. A 288]
MTGRVRPLWWAALAATAAWTVVALWTDDGGRAAEPVEPVAIARASRPSTGPAHTAIDDAASARLLNREPLDPTAGRGVMDAVAVPPPPPPAVAAAPSAPAAPAGPPLQLLGVVKTGTPTPHVFFSLADRLIQARAGDLIDGRFRVDEIKPDKIIVTVLPEQRRLEIPITTAPPGG